GGLEVGPGHEATHAQLPAVAHYEALHPPGVGRGQHRPPVEVVAGRHTGHILTSGEGAGTARSERRGHPRLPCLTPLSKTSDSPARTGGATLRHDARRGPGHPQVPPRVRARRNPRCVDALRSGPPSSRREETCVNLLFVRHGETDWALVESRGATGWAKDFAPLTELGRLQIDTIARDYRLREAEAILCSTFTRALESGALLARALNKPLFVEHDLHEWLPQKDPLADYDHQMLAEAKKTLSGAVPLDHSAPWESLEEVKTRVLGVLRRYRRFNTLVVVTHG